MDKLIKYSLIVIAILPLMHFAGEHYLKTTPAKSLDPNVINVPVLFPTFEVSIFLVKMYFSYKMATRIISYEPIQNYPHRNLSCLTIGGLTSTIFFSDIVTAYALGMSAFAYASGHLSPQFIALEPTLTAYAYGFVPGMSLLALYLEHRIFKKIRVR